MEGLNKTQLKIIAIIAMVCDHLAWGFLDFYTPGAQLLHVIGRLTIPIMCFFIAEGYRKTSSLKRYIGRMVIFWLITIIPFYLFFHEEYVYRQNIILDMLFGLLAITVLEKEQARWKKLLFMSGIVLASMVIGGWPIMPMLYILIFYYKKDFRQQAKWFCGLTVVLEIFLMAAIGLNQKYHFAHYDWIWYDKLYLLGFMLALPLLRLYNGEKGGRKGMKYFFYLFYPVHFLILTALKLFAEAGMMYPFYVGLQILVMVLTMWIAVKTARFRASKAQTAMVSLCCFALMYMFGFLTEITNRELSAVCLAVQLEYFGECMLIMSGTWFVGEFFDRRIPKWLYCLEGVVSWITISGVMTMRRNQFFYRSVSIDYSGMSPRLILEYGPGFYLFSAYLALVCMVAVILGIKLLKNSCGVEKKRTFYLLAAVICPWLSNVLRWTGITGGYEISSVGILGTIIFIAISLLKCGYFDSMQLATENALNHGNEGIMVVSLNHRIQFFNRAIKEIFPKVEDNRDAYRIKGLKEILQGEQNTLEVQDKIYETRVEPLEEMGYVQGYMLWVIDMTEHYNYLKEVESSARTDALTGLLDRKYFETCVSEEICLKGAGCMVMLDLDNFKMINDTLGHRAGDDVLRAMADILREAMAVLPEKCYICRIGGDEFIVFCGGLTDKKKISERAQWIIREYKLRMKTMVPGINTSVSIGVSLLREHENRSIAELHQNADKALYLSKNKGKDTYQFYAG
ncbi:MAG: diguanylate cyclase [Lachnospiraceae bacterium]|nr:diguanylate cyclase [Lachnospiraceae bacterium]